MHELSLGNLSHEAALTPDTSELGMLIYAMLETKQSLKTYITDIREKLARIAEGDLNTGVTMEYIGDFSEIRTAINSITSSLSMTLSQINESASQVSIGADQVPSLIHKAPRSKPAPFSSLPLPSMIFRRKFKITLLTPSNPAVRHRMWARA